MPPQVPPLILSGGASQPTVAIADVAVIGGGPAGSSAAREAAERGLDTLLFDHAHPRRKACGGGLPVKGIEWMDAPDEAIECHMSSISFTHGSTKLKVPVAKGKMVRRDAWDHYLFKRAAEAGATHVNERVKQLERDGDAWLINGEHRARYLIGADGVNGFTRRHFMGPIPREQLFAASGYYLGLKPVENEVEFILGAIPGEGYLWIFPKADHYNIGYCYNAGTPGMKQALHRLMQERWPGEFVAPGKYRLATGEEVECLQFGSAIPSYNDPALFDTPVSGESWVLVGDVAGRRIVGTTGQHRCLGLADAQHGAGLVAAVHALGRTQIRPARTHGAGRLLCHVAHRAEGASLNWTGIRPMDTSRRSGWPSQSSGMRIRVWSGWPLKETPSRSQASRSMASVPG